MKHIPLGEIVGATAQVCQVYPSQILARNRLQEVAEARHIAMWVTRQIKGYSTPRIGRLFKRDHSTVVHALQRIDRDEALNAQARCVLDALRPAHAPSDAVLRSVEGTSDV